MNALTKRFPHGGVKCTGVMLVPVPVAVARPFLTSSGALQVSGNLWCSLRRAEATARPGAPDSGAGHHHTKPGSPVWAGQDVVGRRPGGPLGSGAGSSYFQACRFLQCLNREGLCARPPKKSLFTFACVMEEN